MWLKNSEIKESGTYLVSIPGDPTYYAHVAVVDMFKQQVCINKLRNVYPITHRNIKLYVFYGPIPEKV